MIHRPELAHLSEGDVRQIEGRTMRHLGEGRFVPVDADLLVKRFANDDGELLLKAS
jgi:hypothetical protein